MEKGEVGCGGVVGLERGLFGWSLLLKGSNGSWLRGVGGVGDDVFVIHVHVACQRFGVTG